MAEFITLALAVACGNMLGTLTLAFVITLRDTRARRKFAKLAEEHETQVLEDIRSRYPDLFDAEGQGN